MIAKFLGDTRDMILDGLARLGLIRGGAAWWRHRMHRRAEAIRGDAESVRRSVGASHRMCRECRALVPRSERFCTECGAPMSGIPKGGASRVAQMLLPSFGSSSMTLLGAILVVHVAVALTAPGGFSLTRSPSSTLAWLGAKYTPAILGGEWWRLVNPIFLHGGLMHILFNAYALANLGPAIEGAVGARRFLVIFMVTGIASFVASAVLSPHAPSVGASGALYGLIGFGIVHGRLRGTSMHRAFADDLMRWAIFGLLLSFMPGIDWAAHGGGMVAGCLLGTVVGWRAPKHAFVERAWTVAAIVCGLLPVAGFALAVTR